MAELESYISFGMARCMSIGRTYTGESGKARFRCWWDQKTAAKLGWVEPSNTDVVHKRDSLKGLRMVVEERDGAVGRDRLKTELQIGTVNQFQLHRVRTKDAYQTFVYFAVELKAVDGCGELELLTVPPKNPASLRIFYAVKSPEPKQTVLVGAQQEMSA